MTSAIEPEIDFGDDLAQNVKAGTTIGDTSHWMKRINGIAGKE